MQYAMQYTEKPDISNKVLLVLFLAISGALIILDENIEVKNSQSFIPKTPNPSSDSNCDLSTGPHTLEGSTIDLQEKTSGSGNTYFTYSILSDGCEYSAFSWSEPPDSGTYTGNWDYNQFNKLQFTITSYSVSEAANSKDDVENS